jgi:hypothetical protein
VSATRASLRRSARARRAVGLLLLLAALPGCASSGALLTSPDDYSAYRATRVSPTLEGRLAAAATYLERFPRGAFVDEVRATLERAEPIYFAAKRGSIAGLSAYLQTLPSGAFAKEASYRLRELVRVRDSGDLLSRAAAEAEVRLSREQAERRRVREELSTWLSRFLDRAAWGRPLSMAPAELIIPFSLALPPPTCGLIEERTGALGAAPEGPGGVFPPGALLCAKLLELPYVVKADGEREPRQATLEVAVAEDAAGHPLQVALGGPDLFARLEEARTVHPVAADDAAGRSGGIALAVELARATFGERVGGDPACARQAVAPVVLHLECGEMRLVVRAASERGGDDVFTIAGPAPAR